ncbi:MAG: hypothetical protein M8860_01150 [marine benthic group bacterium]|jgi:hypothetical protein|nr:hypothetical protein [Gemmatimonadota bacterium]MCL7961439.1 hypothetical protein [Candidatus Carthagonibacter metallireducens]MCL7938654.1 hypothetical protein [Gemmatimonadota bacterium]MCL7958204.1 hypothetical protein [Gemmatimonadota bacterium]MCL7963805.1 hypothetical protein [Gemmatimonadota bacterium]
MARTFVDQNFLTWEAYVSGGQPNSPEAARIFFLCLDARTTPARFVEHESRSVAAAERDLLKVTDEDLRGMLARSVQTA